MIKIESFTSLHFINRSNIGLLNYNRKNNNAYFTSNDYNTVVHTLKKDSNYIPIISLLNMKRSNLKISKSQFIRDYSTRILYKLYDGDKTEEIRNIVDESLKKVYENVQGDRFLEYSRNIPITLGESFIQRDLKRVSEYKDILVSGDPGYLYFTKKDNLILHLFYYSIEKRILLTMIIYKDKAVQFVDNLEKGEIYPDTCEIWVDKDFINSNDRKIFHKFIREELMINLFMKGFKVIEKDDILSELIYIPKYQLKSLDEYKTLRENLNSFLLDKL